MSIASLTNGKYLLGEGDDGGGDGGGGGYEGDNGGVLDYDAAMMAAVYEMEAAAQAAAAEAAAAAAESSSLLSSVNSWLDTVNSWIDSGSSWLDSIGNSEDFFAYNDFFGGDLIGDNSMGGGFGEGGFGAGDWIGGAMASLENIIYDNLGIPQISAPNDNSGNIISAIISLFTIPSLSDQSILDNFITPDQPIDTYTPPEAEFISVGEENLIPDSNSLTEIPFDQPEISTAPPEMYTTPEGTNFIINFPYEGLPIALKQTPDGVWHPVNPGNGIGVWLPNENNLPGEFVPAPTPAAMRANTNYKAQTDNEGNTQLVNPYGWGPGLQPGQTVVEKTPTGAEIFVSRPSNGGPAIALIQGSDNIWRPVTAGNGNGLYLADVNGLPDTFVPGPSVTEMATNTNYKAQADNYGNTYIVNDFYRRFIKPDAPEKRLVLIGRISTLLLMVAACALAQRLERFLGAKNLSVWSSWKL